MPRFGAVPTDQALDIPVGSDLDVLMGWRAKTSGLDLDISSSTWTVTIIDDTDWAGFAVTVTQPETHQLKLDADRDPLDTALEGRSGLRWVLHEEESDGDLKPRMAGPVNRWDPGYGIEPGTEDIEVVVNDDAVIVEVNAVSLSASAPSSYVNAFSSTATVIVAHSLGFRPAGIEILTTGGDRVIGFGLVHDSVNQLTITFSAAISGTVYLS